MEVQSFAETRMAMFGLSIWASSVLYKPHLMHVDLFWNILYMHAHNSQHRLLTFFIFKFLSESK